MTRRTATKVIGGTAIGVALGGRISQAANESIIQRAIPASGEKIPVIGLGTSGVFDVGSAASERAPLAEVMKTLVRAGGRLIDTAPMYRRAEGVVGDLSAELGLRDSLFLATKVWIRGKEAGMQSIENSFGLLHTQKIDLMQVHNLVDLDTQLATIRSWKDQGRIRYVGVTHYQESAFPELEKVLRREKLDFVQFNYSIAEREAEETLLPLARDRGVAVLINRPFARGDLFRNTRGKPLPDFAAEFDCTSWAQYFLKWIVANPIVTCAIPATASADHMADNLRGGVGRLPDAAMRRRMIEALGKI